MNSKTNYEEYKQLLTSALENKSVSPVVYLESYFESFKSGTSAEEIANQILDVLHTSLIDIIENSSTSLEITHSKCYYNYTKGKHPLQSGCSEF